MKCPYVIKVCTECKRILVANKMNFHKKKDGKYGINCVCRKCRNKQQRDYVILKERIETKENPFDNIDVNKVWNHCPFCIKVCSMCGEILVANKMNFHKMKDGKYGLRGHCCKCNTKRTREYMHKNEDYKKYKKEYDKRYAKDNPDKIFNNITKRRCREENQGDGITKEQWVEMMNFFEWRCAYSGECLGGKENKNRSIDHIVPLFNGGLNEIWNCVPMCKNYNTSKFTNEMLSWYTQQEFYSEERLNKIYEWIEYAKNKWRFDI